MSTEFAVNLKFGAQTRELDAAINKINGFDRAASKLKGQNPFDGTERGARGAQQAVDRVNASARNAAGGFNALKGAIAGIGLLAVTKQVVTAAASYNDLQTRLKLLTSEYGDFAKAQSFVAASAKKFGLSNREAAAGFTDIYSRLRPVGIGLKDIETSFTGFNTLARMSGISAEGASAAFTQLAQALGSGKLQGDEFRSIAEQVPGLLKAVSDETGIATGKLKEYAADGKLTADIIIRALARIEKEGAGKLGKLVGDSDSQKLKDFSNAVDDLSIAIGQELLPTLTPVIKEATNLARAIASAPEPFKKAAMEGAKLALVAYGLQKALAFGGMLSALSKGLFGVAAAETAAGTAAAAAAPRVGMLAGALRSLAAIGIVTVGVQFLMDGAAAGGSIEELRQRLSKGGTGGALKSGGKATTREQVLAAQANARATKAQAQKELDRIKANPGWASVPIVGPLFAGTQGSRAQQLNGRILDTNTTLGLDPRKFKPAGTIPRIPTPVPPVPTGGATGGASGGGSSKAADDAKRLSEEVAKQLRTSQQALAISNAELKVAQALGGLNKTEAQYALDKLKINQDLADKLAESKSIQEEQNLKAVAQNELEILRLGYLKDQTNELLAQAGIEPNSGFGKKDTGISWEDAVKTKPNLGGEQSKYLDDLNTKLKEMISLSYQAEFAADAIGDAFSSSFQGLISGSMSAQQALANFFKGIGDAFTKMASQMIADALRMMAYKLIMSLVGGLTGGIGGGGIGANFSSAGAGSTGIGWGAATSFVPSFAGGGDTGAGARSGGVDGQGGFPAILHPNETVVDHSRGMSSAMSRYSPGASGGGGGGAGGEGSAAAGGVANQPVKFDISYSAVRIDDIDYVNTAQLQQATITAARQGAKEGEARTLRKLQNSPAARRRLGM